MLERLARALGIAPTQSGRRNGWKWPRLGRGAAGLAPANSRTCKHDPAAFRATSRSASWRRGTSRKMAARSILRSAPSWERRRGSGDRQPQCKPRTMADRGRQARRRAMSPRRGPCSAAPAASTSQRTARRSGSAAMSRPAGRDDHALGRHRMHDSDRMGGAKRYPQLQSAKKMAVSRSLSCHSCYRT